MTELRNRYCGAMLGLACGDAVGTTVEFSTRGDFEPVTDMVGGGPFQLQPGQWTDDTSMALCLAASLLHCNGFDAVDQMNRYVNWWQWGYYSCTGHCFDIGMTTAVSRRVRGSTHASNASGAPLRTEPASKTPCWLQPTWATTRTRSLPWPANPPAPSMTPARYRHAGSSAWP